MNEGRAAQEYKLPRKLREGVSCREKDKVALHTAPTFLTSWVQDCDCMRVKIDIEPDYSHEKLSH